MHTGSQRLCIGEDNTCFRRYERANALAGKATLDDNYILVPSIVGPISDYPGTLDSEKT